MDYQTIYNNLVIKGQNRTYIDRGMYLQTHHIVPQCIGGSDHYTNLTRLTVREHLFAHILLYKIYKDLHPTLIFAIWAIITDPNPMTRMHLPKRRVWAQKWIRRRLCLESAKAIQVANRIKVSHWNMQLLHKNRSNDK